MSEKDMKNNESAEATTAKTKEATDKKIETKPKNNKKLYIIIGAVLTAVIIAVLTIFVIIPSAKYSNAEEMLAEKQFDDAKLIFEELGSFKDSKTMVNETQYQKAQYTLENKMFDEAQTMFAELGEYSDSKTMIDECTYQKAVNMIHENLFDEADALLAELEEYTQIQTIKDNCSTSRLECRFQNAMYLLENDEYSDARKMFESLEDYRNSEEMTKEVMYIKGSDSMERGEYDIAISAYRHLMIKDYKDAEDKMKNAYYKKGEHLLLEEKDYVGAHEAFSAVSDYNDAESYIDACCEFIYEQAIDLYSGDFRNESELLEAEELFNVIEGYKDSDKFLLLVLITRCNDFMTAKLKSSFYDGDELYEQLCEILDFEDAKDVLMGDTWISYFLEDNWADGAFYFRMEETDEYNEYNEGKIVKARRFYTNLFMESGKYFKIENSTLYVGSDENGWKKQYKFTFVDYDTVEIYCFYNKTTYTMKRENN